MSLVCEGKSEYTQETNGHGHVNATQKATLGQPGDQPHTTVPLLLLIICNLINIKN